jgi:hypothetical protein
MQRESPQFGIGKVQEVNYPYVAIQSFSNGQIKSPRLYPNWERRGMSTFAMAVGLAAAVCTTAANLAPDQEGVDHGSD